MAETKKKSLNEKLAQIQKDLKAPKGQVNKFGGYKYRSAEDILEAVKPHLKGLTLTITDDVIEIGGRFYVQARTKLTDGVETIGTKALAREAESKKGMDEAQITGSASSYARKYALNGLFAIADNDDPDATNKHEDKPKKASKEVKKVAKPASNASELDL